MDWELDTPVAFFVFNRPEKTRRVFEQIAAVEPPRLLVVADGPREDHPTDSEQCQQVRSLIEENVDWDCTIKRNYAETNLGLKQRFVSGLEWIFEHEPEAIILEDDCVPNESFFRFCQVMLDRYRGDERVMDITGSNHLREWKSDSQDYHFSLYGSPWGWATWRQSWEWYDPEMRLWEQPGVQDRLRDVIAEQGQAGYVHSLYQRTYEGDIETWDYPWGFARHINSAVSVVPAKNLVSNIGFGEDATHSKREDSDLAAVPRSELDFPLDHHEFVALDRDYDREFHEMRPLVERKWYLRKSKELLKRLKHRVEG